jgi:hypothetical protein
MIVIAYDSQRSFGGYGDRIVGLISCKLIAKLLNRDFKILWTKENIKKYIDLSKFDFEKLENPPNLQLINSIDNQQLLKSHFSKDSIILPEKAYKFYLNQEISQYLYLNNRFSDFDYYSDILNEYSILYKDILIPSEVSIETISRLGLNSICPKIGIQIRAGDAYMQNCKGVNHKVIEDEEKIEDILRNIKLHADLKYLEEYNIFLTSDHSNAINIAMKIWNPDKIKYFDQEIQHLDKSNAGEFSKVYIDNYVLSQKMDSLYISHYSNYGRIAALSSNHDNIFSLSCEKLNKKLLLSKHEISFK